MPKKFTPKLAVLAALLGPLAGPAHAESGWDEINMPRGVTAISHTIYDLHMLVFWVCVGIGIVVFGAMIYSMVMFRHSKGAVPDATLVHSTKIEIMWTIVPIVILVGLAIPAVRTLIRTANISGSQLTVKVTGYQWGWNYTYLKSGVNVFSTLDPLSNAARQLDSGISPFSVPNYLRNVNHPFVVPVDTKVLLLITSDDVIHSWWLPDFGVKRDAIPGYVNEAWFKVESGKIGVYRGACTELCGRGHAFMPIVVDVVSKADFAAWLKKKQAAPKAPPAAQTVAATPAHPATG
jgi:cytochrome c oxidase subunit II